MSGRVRGVAAALCLVLSALLVPLSLTGWWLRTTLTDTDHYVATVAPIASEPAVRDAVTRVMADRVMARLDDAALIDRAVLRLEQGGRIPPELTAALRLLAEPLRAGVRERVERLTRQLVSSEVFADAWTEAHRTAHAELMSVLEGDSELVTEGPDATVTIRLATVVNALQTVLTEAGVPGADRLESLDPSFPIASAEQLDRLQVGYRLLRSGSVALTLLCLALGAAGVALARERTAALARLAIGGVLGVLLTQVALSAVAGQVLAGTANGSNGAATEAILVSVTDPLRTLLRTAAVVLVVVAGVAVLTGPSPRAVRLRSVVRTTARSVDDTLSRRPEAGWVGLGVAVAAAALALLLPDPGPGVLLALVAMACLGALVARRASWGR